MRISCVGGGPAGLYFAVLARLRGHDVVVRERYPRGVTHGWGVALWNDVVAQLEQHDPASAERIRSHASRWHDWVVAVQGRPAVTLPSEAWTISRHVLLDVLGRRAEELGADVRYESEVDGRDVLDDADLVVASDGVNSRLRRRYASAFNSRIELGRNQYIWLGTEHGFDSFVFPFVESEAGWLWAHAYPHSREGSTFIVETGPQTWSGLGLDTLGPEPTLRLLEELFADHLGGHRLRLPAGAAGTAPWAQFTHLTNERWHAGNLVLVGDAAHTAHFSIGSGTRLALQDAMALAGALDRYPTLGQALPAYEQQRSADVRHMQQLARNSASWLEHLDRYIGYDSDRFARLLDCRRSSLLQRLPPAAYLRSVQLASAMPRVTDRARRVLRSGARPALQAVPDRTAR
jgi:anthraniloyl-CoA monooxygenase